MWGIENLCHCPHTVDLLIFMGLNPVLMFVRVTVIPKQPCILKFHFPRVDSSLNVGAFRCSEKLLELKSSSSIS